MNSAPPESGEDSIPVQSRKGEIQLTDVFLGSEYAKAKYVFPPINTRPGRKIYEIVDGKKRYMLKLVDVHANDPEAVERLKSEYERMVALSEKCPHFVRPLHYRQVQCGTDTTRVEIATEYGGENLLALSKTTKKEEILMWILQSVIAFRYCEATRICHLDIKPENMVFKDGILRIIDLGSSIKFKLRAEVANPLRDYVREFVELTLMYAPPELWVEKADMDVAASKVMASKMDVYCWGVTFYQLLIKISKDELLRLREKQINITEKEYNEAFLAEVRARKELREFSPKVDMSEIIAACLRYNPNERCSFEQLEQWLEPVSGSTYCTSEEAANMYLALGDAYCSETGSKETSLRYLQKSLDINTKNGLDSAVLYTSFGRLYNLLCENEKAIEYHTKALKIQEETLGPKHCDIAQTYTELAAAYSRIGNATKAQEYVLKGMRMMEETMGLEHAYTAYSYISVGRVYIATKNHAEAINYFRKAGKLYKKLKSSYVGDIFDVSYCDSMSQALELSGDYKHALEFSLKSLKLKEKLTGVESPDIGDTYRDVGDDYYNMYDYNNALKYHLKSLEISEKTRRADNIITARYYALVGRDYQSMEYNDKVYYYLHKSLQIYEKLLGTQHKDTAGVYVYLGIFWRENGDVRKALEYDEKAMNILEKTYGKEHPDTVAACAGVGMDLFCRYKDARCLPYLFKALEVGERVQSNGPVLMVKVCNYIGASYLAQGQEKDAATYFRRAVERCEQALGSMHPQTANEYYQLGMIYSAVKDYMQALRYHMRALEIREKVLGPKHKDSIQARDAVVENYTSLLSIVKHAVERVNIKFLAEAGQQQDNESNNR